MIYKLTTVLDPELAVVARITRLELRAAGPAFELVRGSFAITGTVTGDHVATWELRLPDDPTAAPIADRKAIVNALLALAFGFSSACRRADRAARRRCTTGRAEPGRHA